MALTAINLSTEPRSARFSILWKHVVIQNLCFSIVVLDESFSLLCTKSPIFCLFSLYNPPQQKMPITAFSFVHLISLNTDNCHHKTDIHLLFLYLCISSVRIMTKAYIYFSHLLHAGGDGYLFILSVSSHFLHAFF